MAGQASLRASRGFIAALLSVCTVLGAGGCVAKSYAGISLKPGAAPAEVQALAVRARAGDNQAQLDLGVRYEEGSGIPRNRARAMSLYRLAARDTVGPLWVYLPSSGTVKGRVVAVDSGPRRAGLSEAKSRLSRLTAPADTPPRVPQELPAESPDVGVIEEDLPLGERPNESTHLLRACRSNLELSNPVFAASEPFSNGFCKGYIQSKIYRLTAKEFSEIVARRRRVQGNIPFAGRWSLFDDILSILRSSQFNHRGIALLRMRFNRPITAEDVLDHVVGDLLYLES